MRGDRGVDGCDDVMSFCQLGLEAIRILDIRRVGDLRLFAGTFS